MPQLSEIMRMNIMWYLLLAGAVSWMLTGLFRRYALGKKLIDNPNERSSHSVSTPRGGGMSIVFTFLIALPLLEAFDQISVQLLWALFGAGSLVALIGFLDDHGHIPARWRLLAHFIAAIWALIWLGGLPPLSIFGFALNLGWLGHTLLAVYLVWLLNLYNFMDGIDGIASIEAVTVCLGGVVLYLLSPVANFVEMSSLLLLVASVAGFLFWNFPKAKIFMGDAGSGFVGMVLGIFSVQAAGVAPELFWSWIILLGAFFVDATVTLVCRVLRGEAFYEAHRSHAYQYASRKYNSHIPVSLVFGVINLFWLLPIAVLVAMGKLEGILGILIAYLPLVFLAIGYKAGARDLQEV